MGVVGVAVCDDDGVAVRDDDAVTLRDDDGVYVFDADGVMLRDADDVDVREPDGVPVSNGDGVVEGVAVADADGARKYRITALPESPTNTFPEVSTATPRGALRVALLAEPPSPADESGVGGSVGGVRGREGSVREDGGGD